MTPNQYYLCLFVCFIIAILMSRFIFKEKEDFRPTLDYQSIINILNSIIEREISYKHSYYKLKDIRVIYNFEEDLNEIVDKIMTSVSPNLLRELEYYQTRKSTIKYVTKFVEAFLIEYTQKNKIKTM